MEFVNVIVDISHEKLDRVFQYRVPEELKEHLQKLKKDKEDKKNGQTENAQSEQG